MLNQIESNLSESEIQLATACKWLRRGFSALAGGEKLADWLESNRENIESIFGDDDQVFVKTCNKETSKDLLEFVVKEKIGDEIQWVKYQGSDRWWLKIWWD